MYKYKAPEVLSSVDCMQQRSLAFTELSCPLTFRKSADPSDKNTAEPPRGKKYLLGSGHTKNKRSLFQRTLISPSQLICLYNWKSEELFEKIFEVPLRIYFMAVDT